MSGIIWLASYPKSGNTWLRAFLANYLTEARRPVAINDLPNHILGDNMLLHYEQFTGRKSDELTDTEVARLRPAIHRWFAESSQNDVAEPSTSKTVTEPASSSSRSCCGAPTRSVVSERPTARPNTSYSRGAEWKQVLWRLQPRGSRA